MILWLTDSKVTIVWVIKLVSAKLDSAQKLEVHAFKATVKLINSVLNAKQISNCVSNATPLLTESSNYQNTFVTVLMDFMKIQPQKPVELAQVVVLNALHPLNVTLVLPRPMEILTVNVLVKLELSSQFLTTEWDSAKNVSDIAINARTLWVARLVNQDLYCLLITPVYVLLETLSTPQDNVSHVGLVVKYVWLIELATNV